MSQSSQRTISQYCSQPDKEALTSAQAEVDNDGLDALQDFALLKKREDGSIQLLALLPINDSVSLGSNPKVSDVVVKCCYNANGPIFISNSAALVECIDDDENGIKITITGYNRYGMMQQNDHGRVNSFHTRFRFRHEGKGKKTLEEGTPPYSLAHGTCIEHILDGKTLSQIHLYIPKGYKESEIDGEFYYRREEEDTEASKLRDDINRFSQKCLSQHLSQGSAEFMAGVNQEVDGIWKRYIQLFPHRNNTSKGDFIKKLLSQADNDDEGVDSDLRGFGANPKLITIFSHIPNLPSTPTPPPPSPFRNGDGDDPVEMLMDILRELGKQKRSEQAEHGYDAQIYQQLPLDSNDVLSGNIYECLKNHLNLDYVSGCNSCINGKINTEFRQRYNPRRTTPHEDLRDAIASNNDIGHGNQHSDYFAHNGNVSTKNLLERGTDLAKDYSEELSPYFNSQAEFKEELQRIKDDEDHFSLIMIPVMARVLRCSIVLHLPDYKKPILFLPYPKVKGVAAPQFGDYFRYHATLSMDSDFKFSLIISKSYKPHLKCVRESGLEEKLVKEKLAEEEESDEEEEDEEEEEEAAPQEKEVQIKFVFTHPRLNNGEQARFHLGTAINGSDKYDKIKAINVEARKFAKNLLSEDKAKMYDYDDMLLALWEQGFLRYRYLYYSTTFGTVLAPWVCSGNNVTETHPDFKYPELRTSDGISSIKREYRVQFFDTSVNNVMALALKNGSEEAKELFEHNLDVYPTMDKGYKHHNTFYHATPVPPWAMLFLDKDYIFVIPKGYGPFRKKTVEGVTVKEEMSGSEYYERLTPAAKSDLDANNHCPCLLPAFIVPRSFLRSTTTHVNDEETARSGHIFVGDSGAGSYYFSLFKNQRFNCYNADRVHFICAIPRRRLCGGIAHVGLGGDGCEHLGFTQGIVRITDMYEVQNKFPWIHTMERGTGIAPVISGGELCEPVNIIEMEENEESWKKKMRGDSTGGKLPESYAKDYAEFNLDSRTDLIFKDRKIQGGGDKKRKGRGDDDDSEEEPPPKKSRTTAKKTTTTKSRKKADLSDDEEKKKTTTTKKKKKKTKKNDDSDSDGLEVDSEKKTAKKKGVGKKVAAEKKKK